MMSAFIADNNTTEYNSSFTFPEPRLPGYIRTTSMVFCVIILGIGVVGNVMVPIVILKTKDMRNSTNIFLLNLSVADLMVLLLCTPTVLVEVNSPPDVWILGEEMCKAVPFVELTVAHASVLTILAISFERYYAICKPLKAGYVCTKARALLICLLAWGLAAIFSSPILGIAEYAYDEEGDPMCLTQADTSWRFFFFLMTISVFFLLPFCILVILYAIIARRLMTDPGTTVKVKGESFNLRARKQVVMMLGTVVLMFFLCLMPFKLFTLWIIVVPDENVRRLGSEAYYNILYFCRVMLYLNSAVNPILYNLMSSKFRDGFMRLCGVKKRERRRLARNGTLNTTSISYSSCHHNRSPEFSWRSSVTRWSLESRTPSLKDSPEKSNNNSPKNTSSPHANGSLRRSLIVKSSLERHSSTFAGCSSNAPESYV